MRVCADSELIFEVLYLCIRMNVSWNGCLIKTLGLSLEKTTPAFGNHQLSSTRRIR